MAKKIRCPVCGRMVTALHVCWRRKEATDMAKKIRCPVCGRMVTALHVCWRRKGE